jgi:N-methylhydantoinase B/oxoprolinase/acetone carboxylase alpha subunit
MSRPLDPIEVELLWKRLVTAVDEAATTLVRTAFSTVIRDFHDYACAIFDTRGRLLAQSTHSTPGLLGILPYALPNFLANPGFLAAKSGDVFITNDPWIASGHLIDITVAMPVFRSGRAVGFVLTVVHHLNVGGRVASLESRDVFEEGLKIPILPLMREGREVETVIAFLHANVREPDKVIGDVRAQVSASHAAARRLLETMETALLDTLETLGDQIVDRSETSMRAAIAALPDGVSHASMVLEGVAGYEKPLTLALAVTVAGDQLRLDYSGTSGQIPRAVNVTLNMTRSYSVYPLKCLLAPEVPNNTGCLKPIDVQAPNGSLLNATFPAPTWGRTIIAHMLPELVMQALSQAVPDRLIAGSGSTPLLYGNFMGRFPDGSSFYSVVTFNGGLGARGTRDGISCLSYPANVASVPIEVVEKDAPLRFTAKSFTIDSAGGGKHRGGLGQRIGICIAPDANLSGPVVVAIRGGRFGVPVYPLAMGSAAGQPAIHLNDHPMQFGTPFDMHPGDEVVLTVPGGGGFGRPVERTRTSVIADVLDEFVSREAAQEVYGLNADQFSPKVS